jgi:glycerol-3-phosphate dehydrogenase
MVAAVLRSCATRLGRATGRRALATVADPAAPSFAAPIGAGTTPPPSLEGIPGRAAQVERLKHNSFDVVIVGGGCVGAGAALDAAARGLKVALVERGDYGSETSSRSTKLLWAGIRYLATSAASLLRLESLARPADALRDFAGEFRMVLNCHRERRYMIEQQPHLCHWVPIALPFDRWFVSPPPFGHGLFALFPLLSPLVVKFYDGLSGFTCPSSFVVGPKAAQRRFPQLRQRSLLFATVFHEAMHDDARTNIAIALTAAEQGAAVANYCEVTELVKDSNGRASGVSVLDRVTNHRFDVSAKAVVFCGGPYTDALRKLGDAKAEPAVMGAAGTHIVLPGYYCPRDQGLLDYNTSDGRFLFFLPWLGHTLVGTTDAPSSAETRPTAPEDEVQWLLNECSRYLSPDIKVSRRDVLSAWRGWRPLAKDPHARPGAPASRDHVISRDPRTNIVFAAGGKWTTWREMAEELVDEVCVDFEAGPCVTSTTGLLGRAGYSSTLAVQLVQRGGVRAEVANHLAAAYGGRAWDVLSLARPTGRRYPQVGVPLAEGYPYIEAEVRYACREHAATVEDVLSRRTRLAFLNAEAARDAAPRVAALMGEELGWSAAEREKQLEHAYAYVACFGGPVADKTDASLRTATDADLREAFAQIDADASGCVSVEELRAAAEDLGFPVDASDGAFAAMDADGDGAVSYDEFRAWWNGASPSWGRLHRHFRLDPGGKNRTQRNSSGTFLG